MDEDERYDTVHRVRAKNIEMITKINNSDVHRSCLFFCLQKEHETISSSLLPYALRVSLPLGVLLLPAFVSELPYALRALCASPELFFFLLPFRSPPSLLLCHSREGGNLNFILV